MPINTFSYHIDSLQLAICDQIVHILNVKSVIVSGVSNISSMASVSDNVSNADNVSKMTDSMDKLAVEGSNLQKEVGPFLPSSHKL